MNVIFLKDEESLGKLYPKSYLGIFLGYSTKSKAYKVWNQNTKVIQESCNVVIDDMSIPRKMLTPMIYHRDILETMDEIMDTP